MTGLVVAAAAYAGRYGVQAWRAFKARPAGMRQFYQGGFHATMNKREAARILGVRYSHYFLFSKFLNVFIASTCCAVFCLPPFLLEIDSLRARLD
jgi:hypothetical protein